MMEIWTRAMWQADKAIAIRAVGGTPLPQWHYCSSNMQKRLAMLHATSSLDCSLHLAVVKSMALAHVLVTTYSCSSAAL